ncbi:MAG: carbohydrate-binding module family 20 domain-containing protein, partial [Chitinophagaceae bacterium]
MKIQLFLRFHTEFGQSLHVLGSIPALGSNQPEKRKALEYYNAEFWTLTLDLGKKLPLEFYYTYFLKYADGHVVQDGEQRVISLSEYAADTLRVIDTWNHAGAIENIFYTDPFQKVLLPQASTTTSKKGPKNSTHIIK